MSSMQPENPLCMSSNPRMVGCRCTSAPKYMSSLWRFKISLMPGADPWAVSVPSMVILALFRSLSSLISCHLPSDT